MSDSPHEQYRPQETQQAPQSFALLPSTSEYQTFGANALAKWTQANHDLIVVGLITNLQFNLEAKEQPVMLAYNQNGSAEQTGKVIDYPSSKIGDQPIKAGMDWEQSQSLDTRKPGQKLQDFLVVLSRNAVSPENYKKYVAGELDKLVGIGEGLNSAKEATKGATVAGLKALTDGTVADFLAKPNAINDPLFKTVTNALDAMGKDPNKALTALGSALEQSSEDYSKLPNREKGHVIGEAMFGIFNPEGSTEAAEAGMKIANTIATHVDKAIMQTVQQSIKAIDDIARTAPEAAQQSKQMLFNYLKGKGLIGSELEYAGIPKGYFDGVATAESSNNFNTMSKCDDLDGVNKRPEVKPETLDKPETRLPADYPAKRLTKNELGLENLATFEARKSMKDGVMTVDIDYIERNATPPHPNLFKLLDKIKEMAKKEGASELRLHGVELNPQLFDVLRRRYNLQYESDKITETLKFSFAR